MRYGHRMPKARKRARFRQTVRMAMFAREAARIRKRKGLHEADVITRKRAKTKEPEIEIEAVEEDPWLVLSKTPPPPRAPQKVVFELQAPPAAARALTESRIFSLGCAAPTDGDQHEISVARKALLDKVLAVVQEEQKKHLQPFKARIEAAEQKLSHALGKPRIFYKNSEAALREAQRAHQAVVRKYERTRQRVSEAAARIQSERNCRVAIRKLVPDAPDELLGLSADPKVRHSMFEFDRCGHCDCPLQMDVAEQVLLCAGCGGRTVCPDPGGMALSVTYFNLDRRPSLLAHPRLTSLKDYLKKLLAKQKTLVPQDVLAEVAREVRQICLAENTSHIQLRHTHAAILRVQRPRFLGYCTQIHCRITQTSPPELSAEQEEALCVLFVRLIKPFENIKDRNCATFFTVAYVVLTLCKFLGFDHLRPFIFLGNPRMKIANQQEIMRKVFRQLGWSPFPVLTEEEMRI